MDWGILMEVWNSFLSFMDTVYQWLMFLFVGGKWPPEEDLPGMEYDTTTN